MKPGPASGTRLYYDLEARVRAYLIEFLQAHGYQPSVRDIAAHFHIKSTKTVSDVLASMEQRGMIRRPPGQYSRALELLHVRVTIEDLLPATPPAPDTPHKDGSDD